MPAVRPPSEYHKQGATSRRVTRCCAVAASAGVAVPGRRCWQRDRPPRSARQPAAPQPRTARTSGRAAAPTPAGRTGSLCCERLRQQRSGEISIPLAAGSGGVATPGYGAGSGEELVAEVVSDAGDVGAHDDGLVVVQVEAEEGGVSGGSGRCAR